MADLKAMRNIGREMARKLAAVGIDTPEKLRQAGAKEAFLQMKLRYPSICLVHLYVLEGAVTDQAYNALSPETKADLKSFSDYLNGRGGTAP